MSEAILDPFQNLIVPGVNNDFDQIPDDIYYAMLDAKNHFDFTRQPWYMKFLKQNELVKDIEGKNAKSRINKILKELLEVIGSHQYALYG